MTLVSIWKIDYRQDHCIPQPVMFDHPGTSLDEASLNLPQGAYTTFRTFEKTRVIRFCQHLDRMDRTAKILGFNEILIDRATLRCVLRSILENLPFREARVRLTMDLTVDPGTVYLSTLQLKTPAQEDYEAGVKAVTYPLERNQPAAKVTEFIGSANKVRQDLPEGIHEALLVNPHGEILEGLSSNFFAIYKGEVWTAEEGVLPGVTRSIVMDIPQRLGLQVRHQPVNAAWLGEIQGAFITSSSRGVLPIAQIDLIKIGNGSPGEITREIQSEYNRKIEEELETI